MEELIAKLDNLIDKIDSSDIVCHIKELNKKVLNDKELLDLLNKYSIYQSDEIKSKIISNPLFLEYKDYETELNLFIMYFNKRLKEITKKGDCL